MEKILNIYGAGLAGCEAAWQAAKLGVKVRLYEMKPQKYTPAHHSPAFAELVCSNSLRSDSITNAVGLLKEELRRLGSLVMEAADATRVPAGSALAVDRDKFSEYITEKIKKHPLIEVIEEEATEVSDTEMTVIATGPLTSDKMAEYIDQKLGCKGLHFFDAAAPIVDAETINLNVAFFAILTFLRSIFNVIIINVEKYITKDVITIRGFNSFTICKTVKSFCKPRATTIF